MEAKETSNKFGKRHIIAAEDERTEQDTRLMATEQYASYTDDGQETSNKEEDMESDVSEESPGNLLPEEVEQGDMIKEPSENDSIAMAEDTIDEDYQNSVKAEYVRSDSTDDSEPINASESSSNNEDQEIEERCSPEGKYSHFVMCIVLLLEFVALIWFFVYTQRQRS